MLSVAVLTKRGWIVSCSSRNRIAFDSILNQPRLKKFKRIIQDKLKINELTDMRDKLRAEACKLFLFILTASASLKDETTATQTSLLSFVKESAVWKEILTPEAYEERKTALTTKESEKRSKLELVEGKLRKVVEDLEKLLAVNNSERQI